MSPIWIACLALCPMTALGADDSISCPLTLSAEAITVRAPQGWTSTTPHFLRVIGGGVMFGPPAQMAYQKPATIKSTPTKTVLTFLFAGGEEKWLWCNYGEAVQLSRRMSDAATECTVTSVKNRFGGFDEVIAKCTNAAQAK